MAVKNIYYAVSFNESFYILMYINRTITWPCQEERIRRLSIATYKNLFKLQGKQIWAPGED